ncbi:hypothetical protein VIGAN_01257200, partial [Vigna angularis var. angularis]
SIPHLSSLAKLKIMVEKNFTSHQHSTTLFKRSPLYKMHPHTHGNHFRYLSSSLSLCLCFFWWWLFVVMVCLFGCWRAS